MKFKIQSASWRIKFKIFTVFLSLFTINYSLFANSAFALVDLSDQPGINLTIQDVVRIITSLACYISRVALIFMVVMVVYYGVKFMMAQGDPTKLTDAKKSFLWGLVGIFVIVGTYTIIATIANALELDYTLFIPLNCSGLL